MVLEPTIFTLIKRQRSKLEGVVIPVAYGTEFFSSMYSRVHCEWYLNGTWMVLQCTIWYFNEWYVNVQYSTLCMVLEWHLNDTTVHCEWYLNPQYLH